MSPLLVPSIKERLLPNFYQIVVWNTSDAVCVCVCHTVIVMLWFIKGTVSLDNQPRFPRITIGSRGEVVVNYLIFAGIL